MMKKTSEYEGNRSMEFKYVLIYIVEWLKSTMKAVRLLRY